MSDSVLSHYQGPEDLRSMSLDQLNHLAEEIREELCQIADHRAVHFASNLGVVELTLALHSIFDFTKDRIIWDTGHQCYPHKILTGRYDRFSTIRTKGGLMGFPNPAESPYDLMMTGHAGCSVGTSLGFTCGDELNGEHDRHSIAVIGDGALSSGIVFESMNHVGWLKKNLTVILNDNKMSICPRVGGLALYLDHLRMTQSYVKFKQRVRNFLSRIPYLRKSTEFFLANMKSALKAGLLGGMLFEEFGFRYIGPIDGHNIELMQQMLRLVQKYKGPVLLHVLTEKGRGYRPAEQDPTTFHAPTPDVKKTAFLNSVKINSTKTASKDIFSKNTTKKNTAIESESTDPNSDTGKLSPYFSDRKDREDGDCEPNEPNSYTYWVREAVLRKMRRDEKVCIITAAMCQGNMLEPIRDEFPDRFFDVGICESHAVVFAAGLAKTGLKPIVDIYSTFMQRSYDQIFQEASLQDLPILFLMDRAGVAGADGPTHHGVFDIPMTRSFPNLVLMSPGDPLDVEPMLDFALEDFWSHPVALRYPKSTAAPIYRSLQPIELGKSEILLDGKDGMFVVYGGLTQTALNAAKMLREDHDGHGELDFGVINARFAKPLDTETIFDELAEGKMLITVEEGILAGGFGSVILEEASDHGLDTRNIRRIGVPDRYIQHAERNELLAELFLDEHGLVEFCRKVAHPVVS